jgi:hypothetical protein
MPKFQVMIKATYETWEDVYEPGLTLEEMAQADQASFQEDIEILLELVANWDNSITVEPVTRSPDLPGQQTLFPA